jgi:basic membrane lipoprotein Med (substrate-binding protein (PBP1-ABC) superfamily)
MPNPWLKKNPFMSLWLSAANSVAGSVRGRATAQAKRQLKAALTEATNENIKSWSAAAALPAAKKKAVRKR